jgi:F-type H+-transporting ATPase subunit b
MTMLGSANAAVLATGRIFGLDSQLLFDILFQGIAVFVLFLFVGYLLIDPVKKVIADRQAKIQGDIENAAKDREAAAALKAEYDGKIAGVKSEAEDILSEARKKAQRREDNIIGEAKEEAARIVSTASKEAELEKLKVKDEVRVEIINVASAMAGKFVEGEIDRKKQDQLIDETLEEIGDSTWLSK